MSDSQNTKSVHGAPARRVSRGVRMDASVWEFVEDLAEIMTDGNSSALIERWAREKQDAVRSAA